MEGQRADEACRDPDSSREVPTTTEPIAEADWMRAILEKARRLVAFELDLAETRRVLAENNVKITEAQLEMAEQEIEQLKAENERLLKENAYLRRE